ncbi:coatomer subunit zeta-3, partial [Trifolium medium]|nr:coatomer subunit zeta-3 [Trifolium medium]
LRAGMDRLTAMVESLMAAQNQFQALSVDGKDNKKTRASISSLKDAQEVIRSGATEGWGSVLSLPGSKFREGLGFSSSTANAVK